MSETAQQIAFVAEGKLFLHSPNAGDDSKPKLVESPFVQGILDRVERSRERHDWKQGMGWNLNPMAGMMPIAPAETRRIRFTGVAPADHGQLLYSLDTDYVGGLFMMELADGYERRLFHKQQFRASDPSRNPGDGSLAVSLRKEDGSCHLAIMGAEGRGLKQVTEGDAIDEAPCWVGNDARALVFQSAGIGRNEGGFFTALSPYAIQRLDLADEKVTTLIEDDAHDYLLPRAVGDDLYYIRRPYQPHGQPISFWKVGLDILLFPFRLVRAIVHFLNFISLMFSRKPLMTAGGPPKEGPDQRTMMLWGKMIDAEKLLKRKPDAALVPRNWQLIRRRNEKEEILADGVLAYDARPDGTVIWTNGTTIYRRDPSGEQQTVCKARMIERIAVVDAGKTAIPQPFEFSDLPDAGNAGRSS